MNAGALAIIADDLTGALDAAAPFCGGTSIAVATRPEAVDAAVAKKASVVSVSTRSREIPGDQAKRRVDRVLAALPPSMRRFKKVDSRLKGNIAAELSGFDGPVLGMPAIPDFGRVVVDGCLQGVGVDQPIHVATALGRPDAVVPDTRTQSDMALALSRDSGSVLVGARGLAQALAQNWGFGPPPQPDWQGPICFAIGSTDPITLAQVKHLRRRFPNLAYVAAPAGIAPAPVGCSDVTLLQITPGPVARQDEVARAFAETAAPYLTQAHTMVLSGGATAEALLDAIGVDLLMVEGEALPGMPLCRVGAQSVVTKSGGFGDDTALAFLAERAVVGMQRGSSRETQLGKG